MRKEAEIKREIVKYLRTRGHMVIPYRNVGIRKANGNFIPTQLLGVADLLGLTKEGKFFAIEVKRPGGVLTNNQTAFLSAVRFFKCKGFVAYSVDDVMKAGL